MKKVIAIMCIFMLGCESYIENPNQNMRSEGNNITDYLNQYLSDEEKTMLHQMGAGTNSTNTTDGARADNVTPTLLVKMMRMEKRQEAMEIQLEEMQRILAGERFQAMAKEDTIALIRVFMENNPHLFTEKKNTKK